MQTRVLNSCSSLLFVAALAAALTSSVATAQNPAPQNPAAAQSDDRPWMNPQLSPADRAELVLKQLTLDEKIALLHGNGMAHAPIWKTPLTDLANGGGGYVEGIKRLGIPGLVMSDAAYGVRDSGANGRYSTALPSSLGAASSWDTESACEYGAVIGSELRAQGFNMTLGGGSRPRPRAPRRPHLRIRRRRSAPRRNHRRQSHEVRAGAARRWRHQALRHERPGNRP